MEALWLLPGLSRRGGEFGQCGPEPFGRWSAHVPGQPQGFEHADEALGEVQFPGPQAVARGSGKCVMIVMPALTIGPEGYPPAVVCERLGINAHTSPSRPRISSLGEPI